MKTAKPTRRHLLALGAVLLAGCQFKPPAAPAAAAGTVVPLVAAVPAGHAQQIGQMLKCVHANLVNRHGNLPCLEPKPPLKFLADAANLESKTPAIAAAAKVKQEEDMARQKIKSIKYLLSVGCGCYDKDGSISQALVAALDDCTESVRLATARGLADSSKSEQCAACKQRSCCSEPLRKKLTKMAYEQDETGCWYEPSARVRYAASVALLRCRNAPAAKHTEPETPAKPETPTKDIEKREIPDPAPGPGPETAATDKAVERPEEIPAPADQDVFDVDRRESKPDETDSNSGSPTATRLPRSQRSTESIARGTKRNRSSTAARGSRTDAVWSPYRSQDLVNRLRSE